MINNTNRCGVSLTELLIVVLVAAVCLIPIFGLISGNSRTVSFNQDRAAAQVMATQVIERFRHQQYKALISGFSSFETGATTIISDDVLAMLLLGLPGKDERLYRKFKREAVFVEQMKGLLGQFIVKVTWLNNQNQDCEVRMATMIRNVEFHDGKPL
jgi:hypothetical protein